MCIPKHILKITLTIGITAWLTACGGSGSGSDSDSEDQPGIASVTLSPDSWDANRIGQRQQLTATARDSVGDPIPGALFTWESSDSNVVQVNADGKLIAFKAGLAAVTATAERETATTMITVTSEVESDVGVMYTVWFARSDDAPALLVDGKLEVARDMFCQKINSDPPDWKTDWRVCPKQADYPDDLNLVNAENNPDSLNDLNFAHYPNPPDPTTPWGYPDVVKFQWLRDRIGILSDFSEGSGTFRVKDRTSEWQTLAIGDASDFQLEDNKIAVLFGDGRLKVTNSPYHSWNVNTSNVGKYFLKGKYIGVLYKDGSFRIKTGINGTWATLANPGEGVMDFGIEEYTNPAGNPQVRVAALFETGIFRIRNGIGGAWKTLAQGGVYKFVLEENYIGWLHEDGALSIQVGRNGTKIKLANPGEGVIDFGIEVYTNPAGNPQVRIGELFDTGAFQTRNGITSVTNLHQATDAKQMQLQENYIGVLLENGTLRIKEGRDGTFRNTVTYGPDKVSQFRLVVDVPVPPARTKPESNNGNEDSQVMSYEDGQARCKGQGIGCYHKRVHDLPSPLYGRFCGGGRPDEDWTGAYAWDWAVDPNLTRGGGPMDSFDALCMHHDSGFPSTYPTPPHKVNWYPEHSQSNVDKLSTFLCLIRYGLENAKLTRDGKDYQKDTNSHGVWNGMLNLYNAIYTGPSTGNFNSLTNTGCLTPIIGYGGIEEFTDDTKAKHNPKRNLD